MLIHRPWIRATSPLRSLNVLHLDAYVRGDALSAYLDLHATLGGSQRRARSVLDVTSYPPHMVALDAMPAGTVALTWSVRNSDVPWRRLHAYVRYQAELFNPRGLGNFPWLTVSLVCHYIHAPDLDAFKGWQRSTTKRNG